MKTPRTRNPLRCQCPSGRILAFYGIAEDGEIYFHIMVRKSGRMLSNIVVYGDCEIQCPGCLRWNIFHVDKGGVMDRKVSAEPPAEIVDDQLVADDAKS